MTAQEANAILNQTYPQKEVMGYWEVNGLYIFNTKSDDCTPVQFIVTPTQDVYGIYPISETLDAKTMKTL